MYMEYLQLSKLHYYFNESTNKIIYAYCINETTGEKSKFKHLFTYPNLCSLKEYIIYYINLITHMKKTPVQ